MLDLAKLPARMFSTDSSKAVKSLEFGYLNAIMYLAPFDFAGVGNLCPHASPACRAACLGLYSGQASMVKSDAPEHENKVRKSRILKAQSFMRDRAAFMRNVVLDIARNQARANAARLKLAVRLNGSSDIAFEGIRVAIDAATAKQIARLTGGQFDVAPGIYANVFEVFPSIQFLDYTKNPQRMARVLPSNYHLTFSRSETNDITASQVLNAGGNVAAVFETLPAYYGGARVINGDKHDLRFLDPQAKKGARGVIVGLLPKGLKAKRDQSGFVIREGRPCV